MSNHDALIEMIQPPTKKNREVSSWHMKTGLMIRQQTEKKHEPIEWSNTSVKNFNIDEMEGGGGGKTTT